MKILITGASGFVGRNLKSVLRPNEKLELSEVDINNSPEELNKHLSAADIIFHLAGVNRPKEESEFHSENYEFTQRMCDALISMKRSPKIVMSSSIQAELDNPYGKSKKLAEEALKRYVEQSGATAVVYRLKNLFGKWCRPNYNSVTATFCHNISHDLPIQISDRDKQMELTYIDDVMQAFSKEIETLKKTNKGTFRFGPELKSYETTLGELADRILKFRAMRRTLHLPDFDDPFTRCLYATYLSTLDQKDFSYGLDIKTDARGGLAEFIKHESAGQIFVSRTKPGITRGNHYHHTKTEKFLVVEGMGIIRFRSILGEEVIEYPVAGSDFKVVDIPPGYTHSIENTGEGEMVTLFWSSEIYSPEKTDTFFEPVLK